MNGRPTADGDHGHAVTTPIAATMIQLLGSGFVNNGVAFTRDEWAHIKKLYGFKDEPPNERPPRPTEPAREKFGTALEYDRARKDHQSALKRWEAWVDPRPLMQAGADRNAIRQAESDGLRLLAWLAKYVPAGEDPLKSIVQIAIDAGWDVDPSDVEWANDNAEVPEDSNQCE